MPPRIVGLTGHMGAGKDTVAALLSGYRRVGFADGVKRLALEIDPRIGSRSLSSVVALRGWDAAKGDPEVRAFLQRLGHGARVVVGDRVWIDALVAEIAGSPEPVVIADVRYPNEAAEIRRWGGTIWKVVRPGYEGNAHPSEWLVDEIVPDATIYNDGDLDALRRVVARTSVGVLS